MNVLEQSKAIVSCGRYLHEKGFIAATDGNVSVRLRDGSILATPTCMSKGMLTPDDLVRVGMDGNKLSGEREVSTEIAMHLMIYRMRTDVKAIVHAHPPTATGFAAAGLSLEQPLVSEVVLALGSIPLAKYGTPGTRELLEALSPLVPDHQAILMANHGAVTFADELMTAYMHMETVEHFAKIALVVHQLGRQQLLSDENVRKLNATRERNLASKLAAMREQ